MLIFGVQTGHVAPPINSTVNNTPKRPRATWADLFVNTCLLFATLFWPADTILHVTGDLCQSTASKVVFCGLPPLALFLLWAAMFQEEGVWAISRNGRTEKQYNDVSRARLLVVLMFIPLCVVVLVQIMFWMCRDGCASGAGDGVGCTKKGSTWGALNKW
jgi:hypothetical protein